MMLTFKQSKHRETELHNKDPIRNGGVFISLFPARAILNREIKKYTLESAHELYYLFNLLVRTLQAS